jgi:hypothetical protein
MAVSNFKEYSDDENISFHDENVVVICEPGAQCFGSDPVDILREEKQNVDDHPNALEATPEPSGLDLVRQASTDYRSQMNLLVNSLWLIHYQCLLDSDCADVISTNARLVPDAGQIVIWVDCQGSRGSVKSKLEGIIPRASIEIAESDFRRRVNGYLNYTANPTKGQEDLKDWSQKVFTQLERIDPNQL